jgi:hypothetical protein
VDILGNYLIETRMGKAGIPPTCLLSS